MSENVESHPVFSVISSISHCKLERVQVSTVIEKRQGGIWRMESIIMIKVFTEAVLPICALES